MIAIVASAITLGAAFPPTAVSRYAATPTGSIGDFGSTGYGINGLGHATGYADAPSRAFFFANGVLQELGRIGSGIRASTFGRAINDSGEVTGSAFNCSPFCGTHLILHSSGTLLQLPPLFTASVGYGVNASSMIVGEANDTFPTSPRYAFVRTGSTFARLGTLGGTISRGRAINDAGQVTGAAALAGDAAEHAFLHSGGPMVDLGTLGGTNRIGYAINAAGQGAGASDLPGNAAQHAFLYERGRMYDLNTLVNSGLGTDPLVEARGINVAGQIVANACAQSCRAYLLTPAGEVQEVTEVPTLSHFALIALAAFLGAAGLFRQAKS